MSNRIGWGVWISKPEYMVDCESFWVADGDTIEDVYEYAKTLEDLYGWYINITAYYDFDDYQGYHEVPIDKRMWR